MLRCDGPRHEPEGCELYCPQGNLLPPDDIWEDFCEACRGIDADRWYERQVDLEMERRDCQGDAEAERQNSQTPGFL